MIFMRILVTGASGQLGQDVVRIFHDVGHEVKGCSRSELDVTKQEQCERVIKAYNPQLIIHCAAYTAVDTAEEDPDSAYRVNVAGTRNITIAAEHVGAMLIYISTDYVFSGQSTRPYREYENAEPQTVYGESKRGGELLVQSLSSKYFIVRTSWVYGKNGNNFVKTMLKMGIEKERLNVVDDQIGSPTYTVDLVHFLLQLVQTKKYGIYHATNTGFCSWYQFAKTIFEKSRLRVNLFSITTDQSSRPAKRPAYSVMDHTAIRANDFNDLPTWEEGLERFLLDWNEN